MITSRAILLVLLTHVSGYVDGAAQDVQAIGGFVQDDLTKQPIVSAWVEVQGSTIRVLSDATGRFEIALAHGVHVINVHAWGYQSAEYRITVPDTQQAILTLNPRPLTAAPIVAAAEASFVQRRRAVPWSVGVLTREDIQRASGLPVIDVLQRRHLTLVPCGRGRPECIRRRMQYVHPVVCVDEREALGGIPELRTYPASIFHTIEVHDGGAVIRGYTTRFMDQLVTGRVRLTPVIFRGRC